MRSSHCYSVDWLVAKTRYLGLAQLKSDLMLMLELRDTLSDVQEEEVTHSQVSVWMNCGDNI